MNHSSLLLIEYLHADTDSWNSAPASMRLEAAVMIGAIIEDLVRNTDCSITLLLASTIPCPTAVNALDASKRVTINRCSNSTQTTLSDQIVLDRLAELLPGHSHALIIAPECDGILSRFVTTAEQLTGQSQAHQTLLLNLGSQLTSIFADKKHTYNWLIERQLPAIPTFTAAELQDNFRQIDKLCKHSQIVGKPRDGAGSDRVRLIPVSRLAQRLAETQQSEDDHLIYQPFIEGTSCSCGVVGCGPDSDPFVLPPAYQQIVMRSGELRYEGGAMPCKTLDRQLIEPVMRQLSTALGRFRGYVGVDMIVNPAAAAPVQIVEINPRVCTSLVGYRHLFAGSVVGVMCGMVSSSNLQEQSGITICFNAASEFRTVMESLQTPDQA